MKTRNKSLATQIIPSYAGWEFLGWKGPVESWKTPTRWLACIHYDGIFRFVDSKTELEKVVQELLTSSQSETSQSETSQFLSKA